VNIKKHGRHYILKIDGRRRRLCTVEEAEFRQSSRGKRRRTEDQLWAFLQQLAQAKTAAAAQKPSAHTVLIQWLESMSATRNPRTVTSYRSTATHYMSAVPDHPLEAYNSPQQTTFLKHLPSALSPHSVNLHLRQLQIAWRWAERQGLIAKAPAVEKLRLTTPEIRAFSDADLDQIEAELRQQLINPRPDRIRNYQNHLRAHLLLRYTGFRAGEVISLRLDSIDLERQLIHIVPDRGWQPKSRRIESVPISAALLQHLRRDRREGQEVYYLDNGQGRPAYSSRDNFTQAFSRLLKRIGITDRKPIHGYRSSLATRLLQAGTDLVTVQRILRHRQIETTRRYIDSDHLDLRKAIDLI
jgi:integrase